MTLFWITAAGLIVLAILFVVPPLLRFKPTEEASLDELNLAVIKQQLAELKADLEAGELDQDQYDAARHDLEKELLADTGSGEDITAAGEPKSGRWAMIALPVAIPVLALAFYLQLGSPEIIPRIGEPSSVQGAGHGGQDQIASMEELVEKLAQRLEKEPDNPQGWKMLGRSYLAMDRLDDAIKAYEKAYQLDPKDVDLLLGYATTLARKNNNTFAGLPARLIEMAYNLEPDNTNIHWLKGNVHYQAGEYAQAVALWEKVLASLDPNSAEGITVSEYLNDARSKLPQGAAAQPATPPRASPASAKAAAGSGAIRVEVSLDPALRDKVQDSDKLFVFARAVQGPRMPLAAVRREAGELPLTLSLDDSMAMTAQLVLSNFSEVMIEARVSKSGDPVPKSGDLEGQFGPVKPGRKEPVRLVINSVHP